ncbi:hypothetical protein GIB67_017794, partial [Kingdonia uniflora]
MVEGCLLQCTDLFPKLCLVSWLSVLSYFDHMKIWSKDVCCNVLICSRSFVWCRRFVSG